MKLIVQVDRDRRIVLYPEGGMALESMFRQQPDVLEIKCALPEGRPGLDGWFLGWPGEPDYDGGRYELTQEVDVDDHLEAARLMLAKHCQPGRGWRRPEAI